jgi:hypothetical protein
VWRLLLAGHVPVPLVQRDYPPGCQRGVPALGRWASQPQLASRGGQVIRVRWGQTQSAHIVLCLCTLGAWLGRRTVATAAPCPLPRLFRPPPGPAAPAHAGAGRMDGRVCPMLTAYRDLAQDHDQFLHPGPRRRGAPDTMTGSGGASVLLLPLQRQGHGGQDFNQCAAVPDERQARPPAAMPGPGWPLPWPPREAATACARAIQVPLTSPEETPLWAFWLTGWIPVTRRERGLAINHEASLASTSPVSQTDRDISHHVTEELVPNPTPVKNAPPALDTATPARAGLFATLFGSNGPRRQAESNISDRQRAVDRDAAPASTSGEQQLIQLQINAAAQSKDW